MSTPAVFRVMSELEARGASALGAASFAPGSWDKRFARTLALQVADRRITDKQACVLWELAWTYRRSIPEDVVAEASARRKALSAEGPRAPMNDSSATLPTAPVRRSSNQGKLFSS